MIFFTRIDINCSVLFPAAPSKRPTSLAGNILVVFWNAFCLCIVAVFLAATTVSVLASPRTTGLWLSSLPRGVDLSASCPSSDYFCHLTRQLACSGGQRTRTCGLLEKLKPSASSFEDIWTQVYAGKVGLITDSLAAAQLLQKSGNISAVLLGPPTASLALRVRNQSLLPSINSGILQVRAESGVLDGASAITAASGPVIDQFAAALPIRLPMVKGVFYLLLSGAIIALIALASEFLMRTFVTKVSAGASI